MRGRPVLRRSMVPVVQPSILVVCSNVLHEQLCIAYGGGQESLISNFARSAARVHRFVRHVQLVVASVASVFQALANPLNGISDDLQPDRKKHHVSMPNSSVGKSSLIHQATMSTSQRRVETEG